MLSSNERHQLYHHHQVAWLNFRVWLYVSKSVEVCFNQGSFDDSINWWDETAAYLRNQFKWYNGYLHLASVFRKFGSGSPSGAQNTSGSIRNFDPKESLGSLIFRSRQKLYQEIISRNDPESPTLDPEPYFIDPGKRLGLPYDWGRTLQYGYNVNIQRTNERNPSDNPVDVICHQTIPDHLNDVRLTGNGV